MRVYLLGYMGSGKSTIGRKVALELGLGFTDLDHQFEEQYRISVADFFEKYDEKGFRAIEQRLLHDTLRENDILVSTGGGTPCFFDNLEFIRKAGISVYLRWPSGLLIERLQHVKRKRPLLKNIPDGELHQKISQHIAEREFYYNQADIIVDGSTIGTPELAGMIRKFAI